MGLGREEKTEDKKGTEENREMWLDVDVVLLMQRGKQVMRFILKGNLVVVVNVFCWAQLFFLERNLMMMIFFFMG